MRTHPTAIEDIEVFWRIPEKTFRDYIARLDGLKRHWIRRNTAGSRYSVGLSTYLDQGLIGESDSRYNVVGTNNDFMQQHFGDMINELMDRLSEHTKEEIVLSDRYPWPGFQIFYSQPAQDAFPVWPHFDHFSHRKAFDGFRYASITVPLELPQDGSGLSVWDVHVDDSGDADSIDPATLPPSQLFRYQAGHGIFMTGEWLHGIGHTPPKTSADRRITFQSHMIQAPGYPWELFF